MAQVAPEPPTKVIPMVTGDRPGTPGKMKKGIPIADLNPDTDGDGQVRNSLSLSSLSVIL